MASVVYRHPSAIHVDQQPTGYDIAIIGGGVVGSSVAYFLRQLSSDASVCVIEPEPTDEFASTLRASGGCRVQFTCLENIDMSLFSIQFIQDFSSHMSLPERPAEVDWVDGCSPQILGLRFSDRLNASGIRYGMIGA